MPSTANTSDERPPSQVIEVELLGVARLLARQETLCVPAESALALRELLLRLADLAPALVGNVLSADGALVGGHVLSRHGLDLLQDPNETVRPGDRLLLLSLSAGG